jgi:hypothetical protein
MNNEEGYYEYHGEKYKWTVTLGHDKWKVVVKNVNTKHEEKKTTKSNKKEKVINDTLPEVFGEIIKHDHERHVEEAQGFENAFKRELEKPTLDEGAALQALSRLDAYTYLHGVTDFIRKGKAEIRLGKFNQTNQNQPVYYESDSFDAALRRYIEGALAPLATTMKTADILGVDLANLDRTEKCDGFITKDVDFINGNLEGIRQKFDLETLQRLINHMKDKVDNWNKRIRNGGNGKENRDKLNAKITLLERGVSNYQYQQQLTAIPPAKHIFSRSEDKNTDLQAGFSELLTTLAAANPAYLEQKQAALGFMYNYLQEIKILDPKQSILMFEKLDYLFESDPQLKAAYANFNGNYQVLLKQYATTLDEAQKHDERKAEEYDSERKTWLEKFNRTGNPLSSAPAEAIALAREFLEKSKGDVAELRKQHETRNAELKGDPTHIDLTTLSSKITNREALITHLEKFLFDPTALTNGIMGTHEEFLLFCTNKLIDILLSLTRKKPTPAEETTIYQRIWNFFNTLHAIEPNLVPAVIRTFIYIKIRPLITGKFDRKRDADELSIGIMWQIALENWKNLLIRPHTMVEFLKFANQSLLLVGVCKTALDATLARDANGENALARAHPNLVKFVQLTLKVKGPLSVGLKVAYELWNWAGIGSALPFKLPGMSFQDYARNMTPASFNVVAYAYEKLTGKRPESTWFYLAEAQALPLAMFLFQASGFIKARAEGAANVRDLPRLAISTVALLANLPHAIEVSKTDANQAALYNQLTSLIEEILRLYNKEHFAEALSKIGQVPKPDHYQPLSHDNRHLYQWLNDLKLQIHMAKAFREKNYFEIVDISKVWALAQHTPSPQELAWLIQAVANLNNALSPEDRSKCINTIKTQFRLAHNPADDDEFRVHNILCALEFAADYKIEVTVKLLTILINNRHRSADFLMALVIAGKITPQDDWFNGYLNDIEFVYTQAERLRNKEYKEWDHARLTERGEYPGDPIKLSSEEILIRIFERAGNEVVTVAKWMIVLYNLSTCTFFYNRVNNIEFIIKHRKLLSYEDANYLAELHKANKITYRLVNLILAHPERLLEILHLARQMEAGEIHYEATKQQFYIEANPGVMSRLSAALGY